MVLSMEEHLDRKDKKDALDFIRALSELSIIEIFGLAHILAVPVYTNVPQEDTMDEASARPLDEIVPEILDAYLRMDRAKRKVIQRLAQGKV